MIYNLSEDVSLEVLKRVLKQSKLKTFFKLRRVSKQWNKLIPLAVQYILYHQEERYWGISRLAYDLRTKFVYLLSCDPIKIHFYKKEREQVICKYSVEYWDYNGKLEAMRSQWTLISPNIEAVKESGLYGEKNCRVIFKIEDKRLFKFVDRLSKFD
ncbi:6459_t:CDS:2 [Diversispora eburnea]|uniref:6459_t:CDS:1 n=1 Tax=Diversispora eburnea TaxID=1213867 RepID=A0A9N9ADY5_9GLOM|nr:6459_t:CDS:2 [Diversispora eburnea]